MVFQQHGDSRQRYFTPDVLVVENIASFTALTELHLENFTLEAKSLQVKTSDRPPRQQIFYSVLVLIVVLSRSFLACAIFESSMAQDSSARASFESILRPSPDLWHKRCGHWLLAGLSCWSLNSTVADCTQTSLAAVASRQQNTPHLGGATDMSGLMDE